jgi:Holliday junction DNA helicase RuvA
MIGRLRGKVVGQGEDWVVLDVNGVGYEVRCSSRLLGILAGEAGEVTLAIETHVREDQIRLFGFNTETERQWFRLLQNVQGVGAKVALSILGALTPREIGDAIALQDRAAISRAPHVGPKLAQRIVAELKDKAPALALASVNGAQFAAKPSGGKEAVATSAHSDAVSALVNLGYQHVPANMAIAAASRELGPEAKTEALIRRGLKELGR